MAARPGLERVGLIALARPWLSAALLVALTVIAAVGAARLTVEDSLSELFRSESADFQKYSRLDSQFPSSEYDVLIVVEGKELLTPQGLTAFRNLILEFQFISASRQLISMFSARRPPDASGYAAPVFPETIPEGEAFEALLAEVKENRIIKDRFLSPDGTLSLAVMALDRQAVDTAGLKEVIGQIARAANETLAGTGLRASLSGVPVYQLEIRNAVQRDRLLYNGLGFALGAVICLIFFRSLAFTVIAVAAPVIGVIWALGMLGFLELRINLFLNVLTPLIMVIAFGDSMYMVFGIRRRMLAGDDAMSAVRHAILTVGPACVLTSLTTMIAFFSLLFSDSPVFRSFGLAGLLSTALVFFTVIFAVPTMTVLMLRHASFASSAYREGDSGMNLLGRASAWIGRHLRAHSAAYVAATIALTAALAWSFAQLEPRYKLADQVPDKEQAIAASNRLDAQLKGANPVHVLIELAPGVSLYSERTLAAIGRVHDILEDASGLGNVWSLESLRRWLAEAGEFNPQILSFYVSLLPEPLTRRFITAENDAVVVTGRVPDEDAADLLKIVDALDQALEPVRADNPELTISVTGLPVIAARKTSDMIHQLTYGLFGVILFAMLLIMAALRSAWAGLYSVVPNLIPVLAAGALLHWSGVGLQFAGIIALTVAFGLAVDNIVHFLHRLHLEDERFPADPLGAAERTMANVGPVVILATAVLVVGLSMPVFSALPSLRLFGGLSAAVLLTALLGTLIVLPAIIFHARKLLMRRGGEATAAAERPAERPAE